MDWISWSFELNRLHCKPLFSNCCSWRCKITSGLWHVQLRTLRRSSVQALAGLAGNTYLNFLWLGLFFSSGSAIVLPMFHNSHSRFHGDRTGLPHTFCHVPSGGGESDKHWLCALQTLFLFQTWYIILLIAQWQVLFPVPSHYHVNFLTWFWQFKQEPHSQCFSAISWGLLFLCLRRSDCSKARRV